MASDVEAVETEPFLLSSKEGIQTGRSDKAPERKGSWIRGIHVHLIFAVLYATITFVLFRSRSSLGQSTNSSGVLGHTTGRTIFFLLTQTYQQFCTFPSRASRTYTATSTTILSLDRRRLKLTPRGTTFWTTSTFASRKRSWRGRNRLPLSCQKEEAA